MSAAQVLSGAPASVSLATPSPNTSVEVSCRNGAAASGGLLVRADVQGSVMNIAEVATLAAAVPAINGAAGDLFEFRTTVSGAPATDGLLPGAKQWYSYKNNQNPVELLRTGVNGAANQGILYANMAPLDATRAGYTPAIVLGANAIVCPSITASSQVLLSVAGTTNAGGFGAAPQNVAVPVPAVAVAAGVGFTITGLAAHVGLLYSYQVIG